ASPSGAVIQNGLVTRNTLHATFDASMGLHKWTPGPLSPISANVSMRNGDLGDLLSLTGESSSPASGNLNADVHIYGAYGDPLGGATLEIDHGIAYEQPFDRLYANVSLSDRLVRLSNLELDAAGGRLNINGTFQHPQDSFTVGHAQFHVATSNLQLANIRPLQHQNAGVAGLVQLTADAAADLRKVNDQTDMTVSNVNADLSARGLRVENQDAGTLTATARTANGTVNYNLSSNFAGSNIRVNGNTSLAKDHATTADASIQNLSVEKALLIAGQSSIPA